MDVVINTEQRDVIEISTLSCDYYDTITVDSNIAVLSQHHVDLVTEGVIYNKICSNNFSLSNCLHVKLLHDS